MVQKFAPQGDPELAPKMSPEEYKKLRTHIGTQPRVAYLLGLSRPTIAGREAGTRRITNEAAIAIRELARTAKHRHPSCEGREPPGFAGKFSDV